jgi:hypothetical protein
VHYVRSGDFVRDDAIARSCFLNVFTPGAAVKLVSLADCESKRVNAADTSSAMINVALLFRWRLWNPVN